MSDTKIINEEQSYFEQDLKYDKGFYHLSVRDVVEITALLIFYYGIHILIFWGHIVLGTVYREEFMWLCVAVFIFANIWIFTMVVWGHFNNRKLSLYEFYIEKINDKEQEMREFAAREEQKRKQEAKINQKGESEATL